jgi:hypothetical protein
VFLKLMTEETADNGDGVSSTTESTEGAANA